MNTMNMCVCVFTQPLHYEQNATQGLRTIDLNWEYSFSYTGCVTKAKGPSLPNYLPIAGRKEWFILFPKALARSEQQTASSMIWTE